MDIGQVLGGSRTVSYTHLDVYKRQEYGIAAHWKYKTGKSSTDSFERKLTWLRQLMEMQGDLKDSREFMETLKIDLFTDEVFVFTPKGDVINLPTGSTPCLLYTS